jgi:hypothetical protein
MPLRPANEVPWLPHPPRRSRARMRLALSAAAAVALLLSLTAGYTYWWLGATAELRDQTLAWIEQRRAEGWRLGYGDVTRRGFPLSLGLRFDDPAVSPPEADGWRWSAARLRLTVPLFSDRVPRIAVGGDQVLDVPDGAGGRQRWTGRAQQMSFDIQPADGWMPNGRLAVRELELIGGGESFGVGHVDVVSTGDPAAAATSDVSTWGVRVAVERLQLPPAYALACGPQLDRIDIDAGLYGALQPRPWPAVLAAWRDVGGVVELERLRLLCGELGIDGEGTFALDGKGQPMGAMSTHIQGYDAALDRLAAAQTIDPHVAAAAKILLRAMARSNADGAATLSAPLSLQDRSLSIGPVTLLRLPPVRWLDQPAAARPGASPR